MNGRIVNRLSKTDAESATQGIPRRGINARPKNDHRDI